MTIHCEDCKYWGETRIGETKRECLASSDKGDHALVEIQNKDGYAFMFTAPDFGCVLGEVRQGKNESLMVSQTTGQVMRTQWS